MTFQDMDALPIRITAGKPKSVWHLRDEGLVECIRQITPLVQDRTTISREDLIKHERRRLIFRHGSGGIDYLIKAFPLDTLRARLKHRKYADTEAANVLRAGQLGVPVPVLHALGYCRRSFLTVWNALCYEYIDAPSMESLLAKASSQEERIELLRRAYPLFGGLYKAGCNHIDFKPGSILVGEAGNDTIIDFQYVSFLPAPSAKVLASQAGHFAWDVSVRNQWLGADTMRGWFVSLLQHVNLECGDELTSIFTRTMNRRYPIKQRLDGSAGQE